MGVSRIHTKHRHTGFKALVWREQIVLKPILRHAVVEARVEKEPLSLAVVSLLNEQASRMAKRKTRLDKGLEDNFPASDPVFVTHTATATGSVPLEAEPRESELLGFRLPRSARNDGYAAELDAIRRNVASLRDRFRAAAFHAGGTARVRANAVERRIDEMISERPLATIGAVATLSFTLSVGLATRQRDSH